MANDYAQEVARAIIRQLEEGVAPWTMPWKPGARFMPYNPMTGNEYHGMNALWLLSVAQARGYDEARWMTYRQAQSQGAQVRKGERAATIQYWKWQGLEAVQDEDGRPVLDENGEPKRRVVRYERPRVWSAAVFNARQIDGLPPPPDRPTAADWERHERCERILDNSKVSIHHRPGDRAYYRPATDEIVLPDRGQFPTADVFYATALHELGHASGHPSRLARDLNHPFGSQGYAREELRAEIASLMLGEQLQIGHDPTRHAAYVGSWIKALEEDPREIFRAAADAEKITRLVRSYELAQERDPLDVSHDAVLNNPAVSFDHFHAYRVRGDTLKTALAASGLETVRSVVGQGPDYASFYDTAIIRLSPVFGIDPGHEAIDNAYLERKGLAQAFANIAESLMHSHQPEVDTPVVAMPTLVREDHPAMTAGSDRTYLAVPYAEKDEAKALGAKWDARQKAWYVPDGTDLDGFKAWLPVMGAPVVIETGSDPREEFAAALRDCGLIVEGPVEMDGKLHRVRIDGDKGAERSGTYVGHLDGRPAGFVQNFRTGVKVNWKASGEVKALSAQERAQLAAEAAQRRHDRVREREETWRRTAQDVAAILTAAAPCETHPYLEAKGVRSHGLRQDEAGRLLVPVQDENGTVWSVQRIGRDGFKQFEENSRVEGGHYVIGDLESPGPLLIAEGYATAATVYELTGQPTIVAFNAGNLLPVAEVYRGRFAERAILIAGDDDRHNEGETGPDGRPKRNVGREKAEETAAAIGGQAIFPVFAAGDKGTDWNDLAQSQGKDVARAMLQAAFRSAERQELTEALIRAGRKRGESREPHRPASQRRRRERAGVER